MGQSYYLPTCICVEWEVKFVSDKQHKLSPIGNFVHRWPDGLSRDFSP